MAYSKETLIYSLAGYFAGENSEPTINNIEFKWVHTDETGHKLSHPVFSFSVNGGVFMDVEPIVDIWNHRNEVLK